MKHVGGINNIATVLSELIESIDVQKIIALAEKMGEHYQLKRLSYIIEKIDVMDDDIKSAIIEVLAEYVLFNAKSYAPWRLTYQGLTIRDVKNGKLPSVVRS
jgi:AbiEi antitoxin C-terminal domain